MEIKTRNVWTETECEFLMKIYSEHISIKDITRKFNEESGKKLSELQIKNKIKQIIKAKQHREQLEEQQRRLLKQFIQSTEQWRRPAKQCIRPAEQQKQSENQSLSEYDEFCNAFYSFYLWSTQGDCQILK